MAEKDNSFLFWGAIAIGVWYFWSKNKQEAGGGIKPTATTCPQSVWRDMNGREHAYILTNGICQEVISTPPIVNNQDYPKPTICINGRCTE